MTSVAVRWWWWLVAGGRCSRALAALRERRADDALRELTHPGAVGDQRAETLSALASVMTLPSLPNAARCIATLERSGQEFDPGVLAMAADILKLALRQDPNQGPERAAQVAGLTGRLMRVTGQQPWGRYNLAVHALMAGDFDVAGRHLASGVATPDGGWPPTLLGAAWAAMVGESGALARCLDKSVANPDLARDRRFLTGVSELFECLQNDRRADYARLGELIAGPPGSLTSAVPQLSALRDLLTETLHGAPPEEPAMDLGGCAWGRWLWDRLRYAGGEAMDVLSAASTPAVAAEPALVWQRLGSRQDLAALVPEQALDALRRDLADIGARLAATSVWAQLVELRVGLGSRPQVVDTAVPDLEPVPPSCPWWPADGPMQTLARREAAVELRYLAGRHALQRGLPALAGRWFADAAAGLAGDGLATRLVALRFGPLLDYWSGVALAHAGRAEEAARALRACADGVRAREARAQLGLLAVATADNSEAASLLESIREPRPASARYLAAILADRNGDATGADRLLEHLGESELTAGAYVAAAHRMRGRVHEARGEIGEAARSYREALTRRADDTVAAARLARVWLRRRHDEADVPAEPLLDRRWHALAGIAWATTLPLIRDCLDGLTADSARGLLERVPSDPGFRLLALRCAVTAGEETRTVEVVRSWAKEADPDPRLVFSARAARAARLLRNFCLAGGDSSLRPELAELERELRTEVGDPVMTFWAETTHLLLDPGSVATSPPLAALDDASLSSPMRLFAGLISILSDDPEQRGIGARRCRAAVEAAPDGPTRAVVRFLAADALGEDRELLAAYGEIEAEPGALPCGPAPGYLAATEARLRIGDLDTIVGGFIPEPLADLADPDVRRAMGIAYARRAARLAERDPRAALQDVDQARELLGETP